MKLIEQVDTNDNVSNVNFSTNAKGSGSDKEGRTSADMNIVHASGAEEDKTF